MESTKERDTRRVGMANVLPILEEILRAAHQVA